MAVVQVNNARTVLQRELITTNQHNFPVLLRLNTGNAAAFFTYEAGTGTPGADLRFVNPVTGVHLPYEINKLNMTKQTALVWVSVDTIVGGRLASR